MTGPSHDIRDSHVTVVAAARISGRLFSAPPDASRRSGRRRSMGGVRADAAGDPRRADVGMLEKDDDSDDHPSRERGLPTLSSPPACM